MELTTGRVPLISSDPTDVHAALREARGISPIARTDLGVVLALRAHHMSAVMSAENTRQMETEVLEAMGITEGPIFDNTLQMVLWSNGATHARRRAALTKTFAFRLMEGMRPRARMIAERLIQERIGAGPIDFLEDIAGQIPAEIIAEILGIPNDDLPYFRKLVEDTGKTTFAFPAEEREHIEKRMQEFFDYVDKLMEDRRRNPREDFLTKFANQQDRADPLSEEELRSNLIGLIIAGSDTTKTSITMASSLLLDHRDQWEMLVADPEGWKRPAALEGQRYEPVATGVPRVVLKPFELDGHRMEPGTVLMFSILSACRDPAVFSNPDNFDMTRQDHPRWAMGFGDGAHRCLGEALAWVEIEESLSALARLAPNSQRVGPAPRMNNNGARLADQLHVELA